MAYGDETGGFGSEASAGAAAARSGGAEIDAAGGLEMGDLAGALADALAGANVDDFGAYAAQDVQDIEDQGMAFNEQQAAERQVLADRIAQIDAAIAGSTQATGPAGTGAASNPFAGPATGVVDDFASGGYATPGNQAGGMETFGYNPQGLNVAATYDPTIDQLSPGEQQRVDAQNFAGTMATEEGDAGIPGEFGFAPTMTGDPTIAGPGQPVAVDSFANMPGYGTMATEESDYAQTGMMPGTPYDAGEFTGTPTVEQSQMGMAAPMGQGGMIGAGQYDATMGATAGAPVMSGPQEASADQQGGLISAGAPAPVEGQVELPSGVQDQIQRIPGDTTVTQAVKGTPEYHAIQKEQIDKSIMTMSEGLMAKAKSDPTGIAIEGTNITNQRMANAFNSLDQYSKAYSASQGGSFLGSLISGAMPFGSAIKGIQGWLESKGMYSKQTGEDLFALMKSAVDTGDLSQIVREIGGGGPSDEDVEGPKEVRSFIEQYPWASELDPKYIQYLIDNPPALQELLGQGPGGGDQEITGGKVINGEQAKPGGSGSEPPAGFTQKPGAATQALVEWSNPTTGETWTAPNGGWQGPEGWIQKQYIMD